MKNFVKLNLLTLAVLSCSATFAQKVGGIEKIVTPEVRRNVSSEITDQQKLELQRQNKCFLSEKTGKVQFNFDADANKILSDRTIHLCHFSYSAVYDPETKSPMFVSQSISNASKMLIDFAPYRRVNPHLPKNIPQATVDYGDEDLTPMSLAPMEDMDYKTGNGKEKGIALEESLYFTNTVPVVPGFKDGVWKNIEDEVRKWSKEKELSVVTGVIYDNLEQPVVYGPSQIWVPTRLYKAVFEPRTGRSIAFVVPNVQIVTSKVYALANGSPDFWQTQKAYAYSCKNGCGVKNFITSVDQVEKTTGLKLFPQSAGVDFKKVAPKYWEVSVGM